MRRRLLPILALILALAMIATALLLPNEFFVRLNQLIRDLGTPPTTTTVVTTTTRRSTAKDAKNKNAKYVVIPAWG